MSCWLVRLRFLGATERATASIETVLILPFIFLVLALTINLGYGGFMRMRTAAATRFAATHEVQRQTPVRQPSEYWRSPMGSVEAVRHFYFPSGDSPRLWIDKGDVDLDEVEERGWVSGSLSFLVDRLADLSNRYSAQLEVPRQVPTGTLLPETPVSGFLAIDGNTWTCFEAPLLTLQGLTSAPGTALRQDTGSKLLGRLAEYVTGSLFYLLGMQAEIGRGAPCQA